MNISFFTQILESFILFKIGFLLIGILYIIFLFIVYNPINSMDKIIIGDQGASLIKFVSLLNIILAASLFLASVVIL